MNWIFFLPRKNTQNKQSKKQVESFTRWKYVDSSGNVLISVLNWSFDVDTTFPWSRACISANATQNNDTKSLVFYLLHTWRQWIQSSCLWFYPIIYNQIYYMHTCKLMRNLWWPVQSLWVFESTSVYDLNVVLMLHFDIRCTGPLYLASGVSTQHCVRCFIVLSCISLAFLC